ncbi:MAG: creatininase family protein [Deltaproteobacteria bacterium]|nr:creatininase family protein [Deltaproteobacteria bacterium]
MDDIPQLHRLTWEEARDLFARSPVVLWPVGSTEPHGPHLALETDVIIARGMAHRAARLLDARGTPACLLPSLPLGVTEFGRGFTGALSIPADVLVELVVATAQALQRDGARALVLVNAHLEPDHLRALHNAAHQACARTGLPVCFTDKTRPSVARALGDEFRSGACHAGRYETSMVLAEDPTAVRRDAALELPRVDISLARAIRAGKTSFKEAGGERAYFGAPAEATAEEGDALLETLARFIVADLDAMLGPHA